MANHNQTPQITQNIVQQVNNSEPVLVTVYIIKVMKQILPL